MLLMVYALPYMAVPPAYALVELLLTVVTTLLKLFSNDLWILEELLF